MVFLPEPLPDGNSHESESETSSDGEMSVEELQEEQNKVPLQVEAFAKTPVTQQPADPDSSNKPLWSEVIISGAAHGKNPGGSKCWKCKHCFKDYQSSYTRVHQHFFGPQPGMKANIQRCPTLMKNRDEYDRVRRMVQATEQQGISTSLKVSTIERKHKLVGSVSKPIEHAFHTMERQEVDMKLMRALCANGIPFNVLRSPQFAEMVTAINMGPKGYKAPSFDKARTVLLDECKRNVERDLIPVQDTWFSQGVSIVSDGWTNVKHKPLINVLAVNSRGAMFMYAEDFSRVEKTGSAIAKFLLKAIEEIGPSNVLQVVTDNAANCKAAGLEIEKVHKHIFWSPCVVHTLNLIFKDFAENFEWLQGTYKSGKAIVKYINNHTQSLAMFRSNSQLELLRVSKTRFASHYVLLKRLLDCKDALITTVVRDVWKEWVKKGDELTRLKGSIITDTISCEDFWEEVKNVINIMEPIYFLIKFADGEGSKMGEFYEKNGYDAWANKRHNGEQ